MADKKRVRPTWEQVRKLEAEIAELKDTKNFSGEIDKKWLEEKKELKKKVSEMEETIHVQCQELRGWKQQYDDLSSKYENAKTHSSHGEETVKEEYNLRLEYQNKCAVLEKSNSLIEEELSKVRSANEKLGKSNASLRCELERLKARGFWERLFNTGA